MRPHLRAAATAACALAVLIAVVPAAHAVSGPCALGNVLGQASVAPDGTVTGRSIHSLGVFPGPDPTVLPSVGTTTTAFAFVDTAANPHGADEDPRAIVDGVWPGVRDRLATASYGRLDVRRAALEPAWLRVELEGSTPQAYHRRVWDALVASSPPGALAGVESLIVVLPGSTSLATAYSQPVTGTPLRGVVRWSVRDPDRGAGTVAHEFGHILGLPDLYLRDPATTPLTAGYDFMAYPTAPSPDLFAWSKWKLGWLDDAQVACAPTSAAVTRTLTPLHAAGGLKALVVPTSTTTALVAEARAAGGLDAGACSTGIVVYRVDTSLGSLDGPVQVRPSGQGSCSTSYQRGAWPAGSEFTDEASGVHWSVGARLADGSHAVTVTPPPTYPRAVQATGLLMAAYRLGEPRGRNASAYSTQGDAAQIGTYRNGVTLGTPGDGFALGPMDDLAPVFDGVDDHVTVPDLGSAGDFTVEGWTRFEGVLGALFGGPSAEIVPVATGVVGSITVGGTTYRVATSTPSNTGAWHHWALVRQSRLLMIYRDGVLIAAQLGVPTTPLTLGGTIGARQGAGGWLKGGIDEVAFYRGALSPEQVRRHHRLGTTGSP